MAMMYPFHVAQPPLNWSEHLWVQEVSPPKESFITTICEHRQAQMDSQDLLTHLQDSVAILQKEDQRVAAPATPTATANAQNN
uniref:Mediator of RNA polymerase II transcription subunit 7 n=2 Tax=Caenorhabditis tropicalis TaxID=1561998 RepID=A0A1I7TWM3_9PELO